VLTAHIVRPDVDFGVPIAENDMRKITKRVIVLSALGATFYTVQFIRFLMSGRFDNERSSGKGSYTSLWTAMSGLLIELSVPACGYYGALHANRQLACCFCSCNLFVTVLGIVTFIRLLRSVEVDGDCAQQTNPQQREECELLRRDHVEKYVMITSVILGACLGCLAFWFGSSLYKNLSQDFRTTGPPVPAIIGEVVPLEALRPLVASRTSWVAPITDSSARADIEEGADSEAPAQQSMPMPISGGRQLAATPDASVPIVRQVSDASVIDVYDAPQASAVEAYMEQPQTVAYDDAAHSAHDGQMYPRAADEGLR
jgi:hypothetical protein